MAIFLSYCSINSAFNVSIRRNAYCSSAYAGLPLQKTEIL